MKCLLVSDLHYSLKQFDWVADVAAKFDVVVIAGDHLDISGYVDGQVQSAIVVKYFRNIGKHTRAIVCSGNHDLDAHHVSGEKVAQWITKAKRLGITTDGDSLVMDGALFTVCPWWDGPVTREEVAAQLERDSSRRSGRWIWVYHSPPDGSPTSAGFNKHFGDSDLTKWIEEYSPDIVLTGHIHESPFRPDGSWVDRIGSTWVFNSGRQPGSVPTHVVVDTAEESAFWFSAGSAEIVRLDRPLTRPVTPLEQLPAWLA